MCALVRNAVPEVLDELQALHSSKLKDGCEFGVHAQGIAFPLVLFKPGLSPPERMKRRRFHFSSPGKEALSTPMRECSGIVMAST